MLVYNKVESVLDLPFVGMDVITVRDTGARLIHELVTWTDQEQKYYEMNNIVAWATFNKFIQEGAKNTEQQDQAD
jgi:hypothetical protein